MRSVLAFTLRMFAHILRVVGSACSMENSRSAVDLQSIDLEQKYGCGDSSKESSRASEDCACQQANTEEASEEYR